MKSIEVKERKKRKIDEITDPEKVFALIKAHLAAQPLHIKGDASGMTAKIARIDTKNNLILLHFDRDIELPKDVRLYKVLGRYVELEGEVVGNRGTQDYIVRIKIARIATFARAHKRYPVKGGLVYITNIRTSKNVINVSQFHIPTTVKVNFRQAEMEARKQGIADFIAVGTFDQVKDEKFDLIRRTGKALTVLDTQEVESYIPDSDDFVNFQEFLGIEIGETMDQYKKDKIVSEIIIPVNYIDNAGNSTAMGFIQIQSKTEPYDQFKYLELMEMAFGLVDKIRDSNMVSVKVRQEVLDISEGGLKVKIDDSELIQYLVHQASFTFDVVFKMQQPMTFSGRICTTYRDEDMNLILGIQIQGSSSRKGEMNRYTNYINNLVIKAAQ